MQIGQKFSKRFYNLYISIPGGIFGLVSITFAIVGIIVPIIDYPVYNIFISMVSHLGLPGMSSLYLYFDICLFISGLINIPFALSIGRFFRQKIGKNKWITIAVIWNCISSVCLIFVGLFLSLTIFFNDFFYNLHAFSAIIMFSGVAIYCIIYSNLIIKNSAKFPISIAILGLFVAGMQLSFLFLWKSYLEWFATFFIMIWNITISLYMLYKKN